MRLWCFLNKVNWVNDFDPTGLLYNISDVSVIKPADMDIEMMLMSRQLCNQPIMAVAAFPYGHGMGYDAILTNFHYIRGLCNLNVRMYELEVPENFIIGIRSEDCIASPGVYMQELRSIVRQFCGNGAAILAILPYLKKEWVVSEWKIWEDHGTVNVHPIALYDNLMPFMRKSFKIKLSMWLEYDTPAPAQGRDDMISKLRDLNGKPGVSMDDTISEALCDCNYDTRVRILDYMALLNLSIDQSDTVLISSLMSQIYENGLYGRQPQFGGDSCDY